MVRFIMIIGLVIFGIVCLIGWSEQKYGAVTLLDPSKPVVQIYEKHLDNAIRAETESKMRNLPVLAANGASDAAIDRFRAIAAEDRRKHNKLYNYTGDDQSSSRDAGRPAPPAVDSRGCVGTTYSPLATPAAQAFRLNPSANQWEEISFSDIPLQIDLRGTWKVVAPANRMLDTGIGLLPGQRLRILSRSGEIKINACDHFTNPPRGSMPLSEIRNNPGQYIQQNAWAGALLGGLAGQELKDLGGNHGDVLENSGSSAATLIFGYNVRRGEEPFASGAETIVFTIS